MTEPANGYGYRLSALERRVDRLDGLEPAVVKSQLSDVKEDIHQLADELSSIRKILTGFLVTFAFTGITIVISVVILTQSGSP